MMTTKATLEALATKLLEHHEFTTNDLMHDVEAGAYPQDVTTYHKGKRYAENGCYIISGYDAHALLKELYNQTDEEAGKFTTQQAWAQYTHLMGRAIELLARKAEA